MSSSEGGPTNAAPRIVAAASFLLAAMYSFHAWNSLSMGTFQRPGPGLFPLVVGSLLAITSLALWFEKPERTEDEPDATGLPHGSQLLRVILAFAAFTAYAVLLPRLGHMISGFLTATAMANLADPRSKLKSVLVGVSVTGGVYLLVVTTLGVRLPPGVWL